MGVPLSLILLPTSACNAACDYCFERKSDARLSLDDLSAITGKVLDYIDDRAFDGLSIYWQGGEVMILPPGWYREAQERIAALAAERNCRVSHFLQSNLIGYTTEWNDLIRDMFDNSVGTSMDYPNCHRRLPAGAAQDYTDIWLRNLHAVQEAGIDVGVIAIPNEQTLRLGAERFYEFFVHEAKIGDFQVNMPFPGGDFRNAGTEYPLDANALSAFLVELSDIWRSRGREQGIKIGPFDELSRYFQRQPATLPCFWRPNCVGEFLSINASGHVAQCDCWVTSYPDYRYGTIHDGGTLAELLEASEARRRLRERPATLVSQTDCIDCDYLAICHGGCPIRAYSTYGSLERQDPYCEVYRALFRHMEALARASL